MNNPFSMKGRFNRARYIWRGIFFSILFYITYGLALETKGILQILFLFPFIILFYINICLIVKRLHDIGKSGKHIIGVFIPLYNIFLSAILTFRKGQKGNDKYGKDPLEKNNDEPHIHRHKRNSYNYSKEKRNIYRRIF